MYVPCTRGVTNLSDYMDGKNPKRRRLTDEEVATGIGRSRATVSRIRRNRVRPDWETIVAIEAFTNGRVRAADFKAKPIRVSEPAMEAAG